MKKIFNSNAVLFLLAAMLFTIITAAFYMEPMQLTADKMKTRCTEAPCPASKQVSLPAINPLRAFSTKFI